MSTTLNAQYLYRVISTCALRGIRNVACFLDGFISRNNTRDMILRDVDGAQPLTDKVCIFSHFDQRGHIWPHTRNYLDALLAEGFSIILVSNSAFLNSESEAFASSRCAKIFLRRNKGYDFGAYRDGIIRFGADIDKLSCLILANDSVYGPLIPLKSMLHRMNFEQQDIWMATDSWQIRYHGQSYFISFGPQTLKHSAFMGFWTSVPNLLFKHSVVHHCEIGLTQHFLSAGLRVGAIWSYFDLMSKMFSRNREKNELDMAESAMLALAKSAQHSRRSLNPTHQLWLELLRNDFPFIKRELLRDNPAYVEGLAAWHQIVGKKHKEAYEAIILHLAQTIRNRAP